MNEFSKPPHVIAETKHLRFLRHSGWDYVQRASATGVVAIGALTDDGEVVIVEQFRPTVNAFVIELPAGLAGDVADDPQESLESAARRELLEETGFSAANFTEVFTGPSSAGLTDELITFFVASGLAKQSNGGGDDSEDIATHLVPLDQIDQWLEAQRQAGKLIDAKLFTGIYLLRQQAAK